jgi:alpha-1,2-mannosyltransferase
VLWILAGVSIALLIYEAGTLITAVLLPLVNNPNAIQTDFHYYYDAAVRFRADAGRLYQLSDNAIAGFAYPAPAILPFVALSYLPLGPSLTLFTIGSYAALLTAVTAWCRHLRKQGLTIDGRTLGAVCVIAVASGPMYMNAIFGQVNAFVLACSVGFVTLLATPMTAGALLAAGFWLKIYPVLTVVVGLWNRRAWRPIAFAAVASLVLIVLALPLIPLSAYTTFVGQVLPARFDKTAVHIANQSLLAFFERFALPPDQFVNWTGEEAVTVAPSLRALNWGIGVAVIALLWRRAVRGPRVEAVDSIAGVIALAAVIAPLGWGHTFVLVLPLVILHLVSLHDARPLARAIVCLCVVAMMVPAGRRFSLVEQMMPWVQNVFYSRYLLAALALIALPPAIPPYTDTRR